jgi:hypothetical protein
VCWPRDPHVPTTSLYLSMIWQTYQSELVSQSAKSRKSFTHTSKLLEKSFGTPLSRWWRLRKSIRRTPTKADKLKC